VKGADACTSLAVPANAFLDATGRAWRCERGFSAVDGRCNQFVVPTNAHIDFTGNGWKCHDGFRNERGTCVADTLSVTRRSSTP